MVRQYLCFCTSEAVQRYTYSRSPYRTSDDGGMEFVNSLVNELQPSNDELQTGDDAGEQAAEISEKDFTLAFARCLCGTACWY